MSAPAPAPRSRPSLGEAAFHAASLGGRAMQSVLPRGRAPRWREAKVPGGSLRLVGGHPLLRLSGSRYRMGLAHGLLLREEVLYLKDAYLETFYGSPAKRPAFASRARMLESHIPSGFREEMRGLQAGTGLTHEDVLLFHTFLDIHKLFLCSAITVPRAEEDGGPIIGRNLDFPGLGVAHRFGVVLATHGRGRHAAASVAWPGFLGTLSGMNDAGLVLAMMVVYGVEDAEEGVPFAALFREALETQTTVEGVHEFIEAHPRTCSNNLLVVEPGGRSGTLEIRPSGVRLRVTDKGCLYSTNHFHERGGSFLRDPVRLPSLFRYHRLRWFAERRRGVLTVEDVKQSLRIVSSRWLNLQAMIFEPRRRRMEVSMGNRPASRGPYVELTGEMLFG